MVGCKVFNDTITRHIHVLKKWTLTQEYVVADLDSATDMSRVLDGEDSGMLASYQGYILPSAPPADESALMSASPVLPVTMDSSRGSVGSSSGGIGGSNSGGRDGTSSYNPMLNSTFRSDDNYYNNTNTNNRNNTYNNSSSNTSNNSYVVSPSAPMLRNDIV